MRFTDRESAAGHVTSIRLEVVTRPMVACRIVTLDATSSSQDVIPDIRCARSPARRRKQISADLAQARRRTQVPGDAPPFMKGCDDGIVRAHLLHQAVDAGVVRTLLDE